MPSSVARRKDGGVDQERKRWGCRACVQKGAVFRVGNDSRRHLDAKAISGGVRCQVVRFKDSVLEDRHLAVAFQPNGEVDVRGADAVVAIAEPRHRRLKLALLVD